MVNISGEPGQLTALFLGNFDIKLDGTAASQTGDGYAENAASWVSSVAGVSFGKGSGHGTRMRELFANSYGSDDIVATNDTANSTYYSNDYFTDDAGSQIRIDAAIQVRVDVSYTVDGVSSVKSIVVALMQFDNGDVYLYPSKEGGGSQNALDNLGQIDSIVITDLINADLAGDELIYHDSTIVGSVICMAAGTEILTADGYVEIENLHVGDLIVTVDDGLQPIQWIGCRHLSQEDLQNYPNLLPITIRSGALGDGQPCQDLVVSPQHRVYIKSTVAERVFGSREVLIAAKHLLEVDGVEVSGGVNGVDYWHFLFDKHQLIISNGAATESLFTGPEALKSVSPEALEEIFQIFPELKHADAPISQPVRFIAPGRKARKFAERIAKNKKKLVDSPLIAC